MSYYYNYYVGYKHDGKVYPWGPYDVFGSFRATLSISQSFASDMHERFYTLKEEEISDELRKAFEYKNWEGKIEMPQIKCLPVGELTNKSFIRRGYFLIEDVTMYEEDPDDFDGFYHFLTPLAYAEMSKNQIIFGKPEAKKDEYGEDVTEHAASDYMYYAYPDYSCEEYEAHCLRREISVLNDFRLPEGSEILILETEG